MKWLAGACLVTSITACTAHDAQTPRAATSAMVQSMETGGYISFAGGLYDGAAVGQTAKVVVTTQDRVLCTFEMVPVLDGDGPATLDAYDDTVPGIHAKLQQVLQAFEPAVVLSPPNFVVEIAAVGRASDGFADQRQRLSLSAGMPEFERFYEVLNANLHPCWAFG